MTTGMQAAAGSGVASSRAASAQYLTFLLAGEEYGVEILRVQEIRGLDSTTRIPNSARHVVGVINLRGAIVPVIDLRRRFEMEPVEYGATTVVVVLCTRSENRERIMGVVVDAVSDVYNVSDEQIQATPGFGEEQAHAFARGLATVNGRMIILLDIDSTLSAGKRPDAASSGVEH